jgi:hypothetical protein
MPNLSLDEALAALRNPSPQANVVPVRVTAHAEDGIVLYASGGLVYRAKPVVRVFTSLDIALTVSDEAGPFMFDAETLVTLGPTGNARADAVDNAVFDPSRPGLHQPPAFQTFLISRAGDMQIQLGVANRRGERQILLRAGVARAGFTFVGADIPLVQDGVFLRGDGPSLLDSRTTAVWTVSLLDPIAFEAEIG